MSPASPTFSVGCSRNSTPGSETTVSSVIVFTVLLHILSFPLGLKQRNMLRQTALRDDINEIKRRYPDDMQKQNELQMELMREHGISQTAGCLPMLIQMLVFFSMWPPVRALPLQYVGRVPLENVDLQFPEPERLGLRQTERQSDRQKRHPHH